MANISPGVYTKIIDLSSYVGATPGTIAFMCGITPKGPDNVTKFVAGRSELIRDYGEPNIASYGKNFSQGLYCAYNYLGYSGSLYFLRCLPNDAAFSNLRIDVDFAPTDATATVLTSYINGANTIAELQTNLEASGTTYPVGVLYPVGRGEYYNGLSVRFIQHSNPLLYGVYTMDVYEKQSDGADVIIESFEISFDPTALDSAGESLYIGRVLEMYSTILRFEGKKVSEDYAPGYDYIARIFDKSIGTLSVVGTPGSASITDNKQVFTDWETNPETGMATYCIFVKDGRGNTLRGWLGASGGADNDTVNVFNGRDLDTASQTWQLYNRTTGLWVDWDGTTKFKTDSLDSYRVRMSFASVAEAFIIDDPTPMKKGSDGALKDALGDVDPDEAKGILFQGYSGAIDDIILDTDNMYFTLVFDCGYPSDVKTAISSLVQERRDCVGIIDNGDNPTFDQAMLSRDNVHTFNNYFVSMYESYNKVYDQFTGQDIWVSPIYHMSYIIPRNDLLTQVWFAPAGFNRAAIDSIKELRFNPRLAQRDQLYLNQLNPIVKFSEGYVVWGQLTSQAKSSALSDLNIVRLVLYCKRALEIYCRSYIFEMNDEITWGMVSRDVTDFLNSVKSLRGLYGFTVEVGASDYEKKLKTFHVNVTLNPTRVVEKIDLNFYIV